MNSPVPHIAAVSSHADSKPSIGRTLLDLGKLTPADAERVVRLQKEQGMRFGEAAQQLGLISHSDIQQVLARQFDYPYLQPGEGHFPPELIAAYDPFSAEVEALRALRSQLMLRWFATGRKALTLVSLDPEDQTSLLAANLAVVFSQLRLRTLVVDANLRSPRQHEIFNLKGRQGLSDILAGRAGLQTISKVDALVSLNVLPAGTPPPNPQELVNRALFTKLHDKLTSLFDVILYDAPAFSMAADSVAIAARSGGVLMVARKHKSRLADVRNFAEQLDRAGVEVVGSVLVEL